MAKELSSEEKLDIAVDLLDKRGLEEYIQECQKRESEQCGDND